MLRLACAKVNDEAMLIVAVAGAHDDPKLAVVRVGRLQPSDRGLLYAAGGHKTARAVSRGANEIGLFLVGHGNASRTRQRRRLWNRRPGEMFPL